MSTRQSCHECGHPVVELLLVTKVALKKQCPDCKHEWFEERNPEVIRPGNYIWRHE